MRMFINGLLGGTCIASYLELTNKEKFPKSLDDLFYEFLEMGVTTSKIPLLLVRKGQEEYESVLKEAGFVRVSFERGNTFYTGVSKVYANWYNKQENEALAALHHLRRCGPNELKVGDKVAYWGNYQPLYWNNGNCLRVREIDNSPNTVFLSRNGEPMHHPVFCSDLVKVPE